MNQLDTQTKVIYQETEAEAKARMEYENAMIAVYVPEADLMTHQQALALAIARDEEAAFILKDSSLNLESAVAVSRVM